MSTLPKFHEHETDSLVPVGYGIDESHDGGFYPYRLVHDYHGQRPANQRPVYLKQNGLDVRCPTYGEALEYIAEVHD